jgi:hypothetical protein
VLRNAFRGFDRAPSPTRYLTAILSAVLVVTLISVVMPATALGATTKVAACDGVNLRTRPSTSAARKTTLRAGTKVTVVTTVTGGSWRATCAGRAVSGTGLYKISAINGKSVASLYGVTYVYGATGLFKAVTSTSTKVAACDGVSLRTRPSTSAARKTTLRAGTKVTVVATVTGGSWRATCAGRAVSGSKWYRIRAVNGKSVSSLDGVTYVYGPTGLFKAVTSTPAPTPAPTPTATPTTGGVYGSAVNADTKAQIQVGGPESGQPNARMAHRFQAGTTSALTSVRFAQRGGTGYSGGTGGTLRITVRADDGSGRPAAAALASTTITPGNPSGEWGTFNVATFPSPAVLTARNTYYIVFENADPAPTVNYISVNELFVFGNVLAPRQPGYGDADYAVLYAPAATWSVQGRYTADMDLTYADGSHDGMGYIEAMVTLYGVVSGPPNMVREHFTVSGGSRTVTTGSVRVRRTSGTSPLTVRLETAAGALIEAVDIPATAVPVSAPGGDNGGAVWVTAAFGSPHVLTNGASYNLRLSTAGDTSYTTVPVREGTDAGFRSERFTDGSGQRTTDGATWRDMYAWSPVDLQFYFR